MSISEKVRITNIHFTNYKAFKNFSLSLDEVNILTGPNNSGKSTILGALRALACGIRIAKSRRPIPIGLLDYQRSGYIIPDDFLPISIENVHTNYDSIDSTVTFSLSNKNKLHLIFPKGGGCCLIPEVQFFPITSVSSFNKHFPIVVNCIPVLGPVEHRERLLEKNTVMSGLATHRASRHFRSYWHYFSEGFDEFSNLVRDTWPGMEIMTPQLKDDSSGELSMFCLEDRILREIYWVGFGFQIWCQLLTHLSRAKNDTILAIDEPETYLHPDIQRQLLAILREIGPDIVIATHSTEIMSEADPNEIVVIEKCKGCAERLKDVSGVQRALESIGSIQNISLTSLARNRRILFVEGHDDF